MKLAIFILLMILIYSSVLLYVDFHEWYLAVAAWTTGIILVLVFLAQIAWIIS